MQVLTADSGDLDNACLEALASLCRNLKGEGKPLTTNGKEKAKT